MRTTRKAPTIAATVFLAGAFIASCGTAGAESLEEAKTRADLSFQGAAFRIGEIALPTLRSRKGEKAAQEKAKAALKSGSTPLGAIHAIAGDMLRVGSIESPSMEYARCRLRMDGTVEAAGFDRAAAEADLAAFLGEISDAVDSLEDPLRDLMGSIAREALAQGGYRRLFIAGKALHALSTQEEGANSEPIPGARSLALEAIRAETGYGAGLERAKEMILTETARVLGGGDRSAAPLTRRK